MPSRKASSVDSELLPVPLAPPSISTSGRSRRALPGAGAPTQHPPRRPLPPQHLLPGPVALDRRLAVGAAQHVLDDRVQLAERNLLAAHLLHGTLDVERQLVGVLGLHAGQ